MLQRGALVLGSSALLASCAAVGPAPSDERTKPARLDLAQVAAARIAAPKAAAKAPVMERKRAAREPCPAEMVLTDQACMDRYEAHLLVESSDGKLTPHPAEQRPPATRVVAASKAGMKPQAYISQVEAAAACENAGKRLCSLSEWYGTCTSKGKLTYPYGPSYEAGRCNVAKPHLLSLLHGANPSGWSYQDFNDPALASKPGFLALAGEYAGCASSSGVHDLVGNLHEWVADKVDRTLPQKLPLPVVIERRIGKTHGNGIFMGGFFSTLSEHGNGCQFVTAAHEPRYHDYSTGFRCCKDAQ